MFTLMDTSMTRAWSSSRSSWAPQQLILLVFRIFVVRGSKQKSVLREPDPISDILAESKLILGEANGIVMSIISYPHQAQLSKNENVDGFKAIWPHLRAKSWCLPSLKWNSHDKLHPRDGLRWKISTCVIIAATILARKLLENLLSGLETMEYLVSIAQRRKGLSWLYLDESMWKGEANYTNLSRRWDGLILGFPDNAQNFRQQQTKPLSLVIILLVLPWDDFLHIKMHIHGFMQSWWPLFRWEPQPGVAYANPFAATTAHFLAVLWQEFSVSWAGVLKAAVSLSKEPPRNALSTDRFYPHT